jgi:hypothetical protein
MPATTYANRVSILAELWVNFRADPNFQEFFEYNDLGLPMAYALDNDIVVGNDRAKAFIDETFALLLEGLEIEDRGFKKLSEVLNEANINEAE